jgi:hypothetical protein
VEKEAGNSLMRINSLTSAISAYHSANRFFRNWESELTKLPPSLSSASSSPSSPPSPEELQFYEDVERSVCGAKQMILCNLVLCFKKCICDHQKVIEKRVVEIKGEEGETSDDDVELMKTRITEDTQIKGRKNKIKKLCEEGLEECNEVLNLGCLDIKYKKKALYHRCYFNSVLKKSAEVKKDLESFKKCSPTEQDLKALRGLLEQEEKRE